MGVPALFRWLSQKYPKVVQQVLEGAAADESTAEDLRSPNPNGFEVDCLYLDLNGIIHPCCNPHDGRQKPRNPAEMHAAIFAYLERIMRMIRPRRLLYLAVDGVAPGPR
jgi:5'-3' exoribonuclease 2